jgi:hypothetical protein
MIARAIRLLRADTHPQDFARYPGNSRLHPRWAAAELGQAYIGPCHGNSACGSAGGSLAKGMKKISYRGYRFPPEIIHQAIWLYLRFTLSLRDVEDLLAERGIMVSYSY